MVPYYTSLYNQAFPTCFAKSSPADTVRFSPGNSLTRCDGDTPLGSCLPAPPCADRDRFFPTGGRFTCIDRLPPRFNGHVAHNVLGRLVDVELSQLLALGLVQQLLLLMPASTSIYPIHEHREATTQSAEVDQGTCEWYAMGPTQRTRFQG